MLLTKLAPVSKRIAVVSLSECILLAITASLFFPFYVLFFWMPCFSRTLPCCTSIAPSFSLPLAPFAPLVKTTPCHHLQSRSTFSLSLQKHPFKFILTFFTLFLSIVNKVTVVGRVGQDAELNSVGSDRSVVHFSVATSESKTDPEGTVETKQRRKDWWQFGTN
jgi:hypothetical protein